MKRLTTMILLSLATLSVASCGKSPTQQCEAIYQKGDGEKPYSTDKTKFMDVCTKASDAARHCLLLKGKDRFKDDSCGPTGKAWDESMKIMQQGQGSNAP